MRARRPWRSGPFLLGALAVSAAAAGPARGDELRVSAYLETIRFDLANGALLLARRDGAPQDPGPYELRTDPLRLRGVRGEVVALQLVVSGAAGIHEVSADPVRGEDGAPSPVGVEIFDARGVHVDRPSESSRVFSLGKGLYPDALVPTSTVQVPIGRGMAVLWVDVFIDEATPAGTHTTTLRLGRETTVPVELEVLDVVLPPGDVARLGAVNFGSLLERGKRSPEALRRWMQLAHAHRLAVEVMRPTPPASEEGVIDWERWAAFVGPYIDGSAFTAAQGYRGPRAGVPTPRFVIPLTDWWPVPATSASLPSDPARWSEALKAWEDFVERRGWFDLPQATRWILFINSLDEPKERAKLESLAAYAELIRAAALKDRDRVLFRVDGNFGQPIPGVSDEDQAELLGPVVDLWNAHGAPETLPWDLLVHRRDVKGEKLMFYASNTGGEPSYPPLVLDSPLVGARAWGWLVYRYRLEGALNWEVDVGPGCVENPQCSPGGGLNLDATLIYRGEEVGAAFDQPIASMRLKVLRRGAQDAALLALLEAQNPEAAQTLVKDLIPAALGDGVPALGQGAWSVDPGAWERARQAILDRLSHEPRPLPLGAVRLDEGPPWLRYRQLWFVAAGVLAALLASGVRLLWRRRVSRGLGGSRR